MNRFHFWNQFELGKSISLEPRENQWLTGWGWNWLWWCCTKNLFLTFKIKVFFVKRVGGSSKTTFTLKANVQFMFALHFRVQWVASICRQTGEFHADCGGPEKSQAGCWRRTVSLLCLTAGWCRVTTFTIFCTAQERKGNLQTATMFRDLKG